MNSSRRSNVTLGRIFFASIWSVAWALGAVAIALSDISASQMLWAFAGTLVAWSVGIGCAFFVED